MINSLISALLIFFLSPLFIVVAVIIFFDDGFPVIFRQKRIGKNNIFFTLYKFRTMKKNISDIPTHLLDNKKNIYTKTGLFFRKYSIDELPQLFNIFKGEMNFIGPRPALHNQEDLIELRIKKNVSQLKPGITGWAQINGRDNLSIKKKVDLDFYYYKSKCFKLNLKIIFFTLLKVIKSEGVQK